MDKASKIRRTVYVRFPWKTLKQLERRAKRERRSRNQLISDAVDDFRKKGLNLLLFLLLVGAAGWLFLPDRNGNGIPDIMEKLFTGKEASPGWIEKSFGLLDNEIELRLGLKPHAIENAWEIDQAQPDWSGLNVVFREVYLC